ncbi:transcriptional regulator, TetR family [Lachnospiraceae bacterium KM106-2]|nr:transcriptional regulator, TetR family [Lachnospiraceae bacterium KM106-2]
MNMFIKEMSTIPKVIENLRENILVEARKELFEDGYQAFNIRTVAAKCEVAVGTFYNYFSSKDMVIASVVLEDWMKSLDQMKRKVERAEELFTGLEAIYGELLAFEELYHNIFQNSTAVYSKYSSRERHQKLRSQLEEPIRQLCKRKDQSIDDFTITFLAENFLSASQEQIEFAKLQAILQKVLA